MPRPTKIIQYKLEDRALKARNDGLTAQATADLLNRLLKRRGVNDTVTLKAVERYWATLDRASVAPAHQPQLAEENAALAINVGGDLQQLAATLRGWFEEAQTARVEKVIPVKPTKDDPDPEPIRVDLGPDWGVRLSTSREFRETLKFAADVLERIYNAEQIREFQQAVLEAIGEASPETAARIREAMVRRSELVRARLLGL